MTDEEIRFFKRFFNSRREAFRIRDWKISMDEWLQFWESSPLFEKKFNYPRSVRLSRLDAQKAWTVDNLDAHRCQGSRSTIKRAQPVKPVDSTPSRTLTVEQWLSEIRQ